jgi:transaldolase
MDADDLSHLLTVRGSSYSPEQLREHLEAIEQNRESLIIPNDCQRIESPTPRRRKAVTLRKVKERASPEISAPPTHETEKHTEEVEDIPRCAEAIAVECLCICCKIASAWRSLKAKFSSLFCHAAKKV